MKDAQLRNQLTKMIQRESYIMKDRYVIYKGYSSLFVVTIQADLVFMQDQLDHIFYLDTEINF